MDERDRLELETTDVPAVENPEADTNENAFAIVSPISGNNPFAIECLGDRVLVLEDRMKLGNECKTCEGIGWLNQPCKYCGGDYAKPGEGGEEAHICRFCTIERGTFGLKSNYGKATCPDCKGKGALVVLPQTSEKRPTTGVVKSVGPDVVNLKPGDRVMYALFGGTGIIFRQQEKIRVMHEHEVWARLHGMVNNQDMRLL